MRQKIRERLNYILRENEGRKFWKTRADTHFGNCCERCSVNISTTGRGLVGKVCGKARAEAIAVQSNRCRGRYHIVWLECSRHLLCPWVQYHAQAATQHSPGRVRKDFSLGQQGTSHPAHTQRLQEAESKLLVNWEQKHMYVQFTALSGFAKLWDRETLCCAASIQRSL